MNLSLKIAQRYLVAKKSHNVINIISLISVIGVMVGSMALIIVLSVFNGFGDLVISLYDSFDPDVKITIAEGKYFSPSLAHVDEIKKIEGVKSISLSLEENALIKHEDRQFIATIKGVDTSYLSTNKLNEKIIDGSLLLQSGEKNFAVLGSGVAYGLSVNLSSAFTVLTIYTPKKGELNTLIPEESFNSLSISPSGVFSIQQDFDSKYVLVPLRFARELTGEEEKISAIEISLAKNADVEKIITQLKNTCGNNFEIKGRDQQHDFFYKILKSEKWIVYLILTFILIIATFNILGTLTMLVIEKQRDIKFLQSMGADSSLIKKIFLFEGLIITCSGAIIGLLLGLGICLLQQKFGFVQLGSNDAFVVNAYPVSLQLFDFGYVFVTVFLIGLISSWFTSTRLVQKIL